MNRRKKNSVQSQTFSHPAGKFGKEIARAAHPPTNRNAAFLLSPLVQKWLWGLFLVAATVVAYQPAWHGGFVWDDDAHISTNMALRSLSGLRDIWLKPGATCQYYPLSFSAFWVGYHLWGLNTLGYHLLTLLLHCLTAVLLWQVLARLKVRGAFLAGAIFALHPVCVMSVAWMTELKNTLSGALALGVIWAYLRFAGLGVYARDESPGNGVRPDWRFYILVLALFQLGLLAKTAVSFLPVTLLLILWWQRTRLRWRDIWPFIPMLGMAIIMGQLTSHVEQHSGGASGKEYDVSFLERVLISGRSFWFYLGKLFFPYKLTFIYPRWEINPAAWWQYLYPAATLGLFGMLWGMRRRISKGPFAAMLHFYVSTSFLILVLVLYMTRYSFVTDHWQYFGCPSVIALIAAGISSVLDRFKKKSPLLKPACCGVLLLTLGLLTWRQTKMYADLETLLQTTIDRNPACWMAYNNLGYALLEKGQRNEAILHFQKSLAIQPDNAAAENNFGIALLGNGQVDEAVIHFQKSLTLQPDYALAHNSLGIALLRKGQVDAAIAHLRTAVAFKPDYANAHFILGDILRNAGNVEEAILHLQQALKIQPDSVKAQNALDRIAWLLATSPDASVRNGIKAVELARQTDELSGGTNPIVAGTLAAAYAEAGRFAEASTTAERALQLAASQNNSALVAALSAQLKLYQAGSPFHDSGATH